MGAKVRFDGGYWWVVIHHAGKKEKKSFGRSEDSKQDAEVYAAKLNAEIKRRRRVSGVETPVRLPLSTTNPAPLRCADELRKWQSIWAPTFKRSYEYEVETNISKHLVPHFGDIDLHELTEDDVLRYIGVKLAEDYSSKTIENHLTILRRVLSLLEKKKLLSSNPAADIKALLNRVRRRTDEETKQVDTWTIEEAQTLLEVAEGTAPRFHPLLATALYTGMRRGELLALKWQDVDFDRRRIQVRRSLVRGRIGTPKNGRTRAIEMAAPLVELLRRVERDLKRETLKRGWRRVPGWVFPSGACTPIGERNLERTWAKVRKKAVEQGVRPLVLHCTRHTWVSLALASGKSIKWIADQIGHADVSLTLNTYAHLIPKQEHDLSFLDFKRAARSDAQVSSEGNAG